MSQHSYNRLSATVYFIVIKISGSEQLVNSNIVVIFLIANKSIIQVFIFKGEFSISVSYYCDSNLKVMLIWI